jgi:hypothetical protein
VPVVTVKQLVVDVVDWAGLLAVVVLTNITVLVVLGKVRPVVGGVLLVLDVVTVVVLQQKPSASGSSCTSRGLQTSRIFTVELNVPLLRSLAQRTAS